MPFPFQEPCALGGFRGRGLLSLEIGCDSTLHFFFVHRAHSSMGEEEVNFQLRDIMTCAAK